MPHSISTRPLRTVWDGEAIGGTAQCPSPCRDPPGGPWASAPAVLTTVLNLALAWPRAPWRGVAHFLDCKGGSKNLPRHLEKRPFLLTWGLHCLFQIHSYTRGCHSDRSLGHLSVAETELLRDPEGGRQVRAAVCWYHRTAKK